MTLYINPKSWEKRDYAAPIYKNNDPPIWGLTAYILDQFIEEALKPALHSAEEAQKQYPSSTVGKIESSYDTTEVNNNTSHVKKWVGAYHYTYLFFDIDDSIHMQ